MPSELRISSGMVSYCSTTRVTTWKKPLAKLIRHAKTRKQENKDKKTERNKKKL